MTEQTISTAAVRAQETTASTPAEVTLIVNGAPTPSSCATLAELLIALEFDGTAVATAVNGDFVPAADRTGHRLAPGDNVEILSPRQGG
jgi:sulfur carrier protein